MKVFISYGMHDRSLVRELESRLGRYAELLYWDKSKEPGKDVWPTIFKWIKQSGIVIPIITGQTVERAMAVAQEVGHAKALGKMIIPLVENTIPPSELGFLAGVTYIPVDVRDHAPALQAVERTIATLKLSKEDAIFAAVLIGITLAAIWALSED